MSAPQWLWDSVPHYRLTQSIVDTYLKEKFGNYSTFRTEVNILVDTRRTSQLTIAVVFQRYLEIFCTKGTYTGK